MKNAYFQNMDFAASRWHSRGQRFDPAFYLHQRTVTERWLFLLLGMTLRNRWPLAFQLWPPQAAFRREAPKRSAVRSRLSPPKVPYSNLCLKGSDSGKEFFIVVCNRVVSINPIEIPCCAGMTRRGKQREGSAERSFITIDFVRTTPYNNVMNDDGGMRRERWNQTESQYDTSHSGL